MTLEDKLTNIKLYKMKFIIKALLLTVMVCTVFTKTKAQTEIQAATKTYSEIFDSLSTGLIPSRIPYGTLIDRTYIWSGLDAWQNNDTTSIRQLYQGWYDAEQAVINPTYTNKN